MRLAKSVEAGSDPDRLHLENLVETSNKTIQQLRLQLEYLHEQGLPSVCQNENRVVLARAKCVYAY